jgi:hypothetical protein
MWWEKQQKNEAKYGVIKYMSTLMAYLKPTKSNMLDDATCQLCAKWKGTFHFPKLICIPKSTIQLLHIIGKTFVNREVF